ncbi:beta-ketoacyl-[acyl-carrier-protein] synthase family protein [Nocardia cyriacigeorgica]|uniref:3-oxoacyl-[acyl-carrier-protein] synthase 2 n=1 Tax=Nocardia cyriacigeorgica TaxID=135487 RepID=A0A4U8VZB3_9NOCA|nr:beta-ketoacyl-[acyl-carrier-protein] synthase family protein [Nocardia cyriacigeorgica]VFA99070.1 3-oxoacyl-[acyl-carrier-protein] synthase 2 [Nocardia cyriacigeorgica]
MSSPKRIVVAGIGAVTSQGRGADRMWQGFLDGHVAIDTVESLDLSGHSTTIGGEVRPWRTEATRAESLDPAVQFALAAAAEAIDGARIRPLGDEDAAVPATRWGVAVGTCNGGLGTVEQTWLADRDGNATDWQQYLMIQPQIIAEALSAEFGLRGPVLSVNTACAAGAHAIAHAVEMIRIGRADAMLVGGTDAFNATVFAGFHSLESLSPIPPAPYSKDRRGLSLGEGSGMLVLVEHSVAVAAGAPILAEVLGYGLSADGHHPTAPHPEGAGAARALSAAFTATGVTPADVSYVNGHGTGTPKNDSAESNAVRRAFGPAAEKIALTSVKSMIGHLLGAAGAVEGIATVLALRDQIAPPTAGFTGPDPKCGLDAVPNTARPLPMDVAMSNNFAFAGANATVVFGREGRPASPVPEPPIDRVVITGLGIILPGGTTAGALFDTYRAGRSGDDNSTELALSTPVFDPAPFLSPKQRRRMDRLGVLAVASSRMALDDGRLDPDAFDSDRIGVIVGTGLGPVESLEEFTVPVLESGVTAANPAVFPNTVYNAAAGQVSMALGVRGPTSTLTAAHAAGATALGVAYDLLRIGAADAALCPAVDTLSPCALRAYRRMPAFADAPSHGYRLAEGALTLLLERESVARSRGARILAVVAGYGNACDGLGIGRWDREGRGIERAMRGALDESGLAPGDVSAIWANAAGLPAVDDPERAAIARLTGGSGPRVETPKQILGEPVGAGAHLCAALAVHDPAGFDGPVLINSSSMGGTHTCLVLTPDTHSSTSEHHD